jgi:signal recognition particle GTPase
MKQKTETKLRIEFNLDIENRPLKEDISKNSIGLSAFREQYKNALSAIDQYLAIARKDAHDRDLDSQNNIFLFVGERGSGKTSCILSVANMLAEEDKNTDSFFDQMDYHFLKE